MSEVTQSAENVVQDYFGIFNKKAEDVKMTNNEDNGPSIYFNPDSINAPDKTYSARIRFLANINNPDVALVSKVTYTFPKLDGTKVYYQSPKSLDTWADCIVANKYFAWKKSEDARLKSLVKDFKWNSRKYALIQVIEDYVNKENNGKIFVWTLPADIEKKINDQLRPSAQAIRDGEVANNVFDPVEGFVFSLDIPVETYTKADGKTDNKRVYTKCKFLPALDVAMVLEGKTWSKTEARANEAEFQQKAIKTLVENNLLKDISYVPETQEKLVEINTILTAYETGTLPTAQAPGMTPAQNQVVAPQTQQPIQAPVQQTQQVAQPAQVQENTSATQPVNTPQASNQASDDIYNDIFDEQA